LATPLRRSGTGEDEQVEPGNEIVLSVRDLRQGVGRFEPFNLTVRKGEIVSLVGLVGSGQRSGLQVYQTGLEKT